MMLSRLALLSALLAAPLSLALPLAGCGPRSDAPRMVGAEALRDLPKDDDDYKPSPKTKKFRAGSAARSLKVQ